MAGASVALFLYLFVPGVRAELLAQYDFEGETLVASQTHSWITASSLSYSGDGTVGFLTGHDSTKSYKSTKWPEDATLDDYFGFSITVAPGWIVNVTNLTFFQYRSDTGPTNWVTRYSVDDSTFYTLGANGTLTGWGASSEVSTDVEPLDLSGTNYFRIYAANASAPSGTWRIDDLELHGTAVVDTGRRHIRHQSYDGAHHDNWAATTNQNSGTIQRSQSMAGKGAWALELVGSASHGHPEVVFGNVSLSGVSNAGFSVSYAADEPDGDEDLWMAASHDGGSTWSSNKLVDGVNGLDLPFGSDGEVSNPYQPSIGSTETQARLKIVFLDDAGSPPLDYYYLDSVSLLGVPTPAAATAAVSVYGGYDNVTTNSAALSGHVTGGYPYPTVTVYYGPSDGFDADGGWAYSSNLGVHAWGLFTNTLSDLDAGQTYYYRYYASNSEGASWASSSSNFTTQAGTVDATGGLYIDSLGVAAVMPMSIDNDGDGLPDRWEELAFGNTSSNANADPDGDQITALYEFYAGTDPTDSNSYMRLVDVDLETKAGNNLAIQWVGGAYMGGTQFLAVGDAPVARTFSILGVDAVDESKSPLGTVVGQFQATNTWVDTNAVTETAQRFYEVAVSVNGKGYTNTQEWAMHVQPRRQGQRYLVTVPVDYVVGSNALDSTLGEQIARGLTPGNQHNAPGADQIQFDDGLSFSTYTLVTNGSGGVEWWNGSGKSSRVVDPGEGFWVFRTNSVAVRTNMVFVGLTRTSNVPTVSITSANEAQGWDAQIFGWPYSTSESTSGATTNPFGFAGKPGAYGGAAGGSTTDHDRHGDQIWYLYDDNGTNKWRYIWLVNTGTTHPHLNDTWWDSTANPPTNAVFSLEPGKAYYYRHHVKYTNGTPTGSQFNWQPVLP